MEWSIPVLNNTCVFFNFYSRKCNPSHQLFKSYPSRFNHTWYIFMISKVHKIENCLLFTYCFNDIGKDILNFSIARFDELITTILPRKQALPASRPMGLLPESGPWAC